MIKKINNKIVFATDENIVTVSVEINGKSYSRRYLLRNGKVSKTIKDGLQELVDDLLIEWKKCSECLAHYQKKHKCDGLMKMLTKSYKKKKKDRKLEKICKLV